ncbi:MAG: Spy/CpxP family protein refolding chaperone [Bacteroidales bacterium]|nr:Spy/CpxP family protein refolding chaperone [Bacteroidales bacterium]
MKKLILALTAIFFLAGQLTMAQVESGKKSNMDKKGMKSEKMMHKQDMSQQKHKMQEQRMMSMMMDQQMMMKKKVMLINNLPDMKEKLNLTDDQVNTLIDMRTNFKKEQIDREAELEKKHMKMKNLLDEEASLEDIREQMENCSVSMINMKMEALSTSRKMMNVLSEEQKVRLQPVMDDKTDMHQQRKQ